MADLAYVGQVDWDEVFLVEVVLNQVLVLVDVDVAVDVHKHEVTVCLVEGFHIARVRTLVSCRADAGRQTNSKVVELV